MKARLIYEILMDGDKLIDKVSFDIPKEQEMDSVQLIVLTKLANDFKQQFVNFMQVSGQMGIVMPGVFKQILEGTQKTSKIISLNEVKKGKN
jgi:hypothetical protein